MVSPTKIERYYHQHMTNFLVGEQMKIRAIVRSVPEPPNSPEVRKLMLEIGSKINPAQPASQSNLITRFAEMATVYSEGSQSQQRGDWGWQERSYWMAGLSDVAAELEPGHRSELIGVQGDSGTFPYRIYLYDATGAVRKIRTYVGDPGTKKEKLAQETTVNGVLPPGMPEPKEYYWVFLEARRASRVKPLTEVQDEIEKELFRTETRRLEKKWIDRLRSKAFVRYF
jgi:hypothetical protein